LDEQKIPPFPFGGLAGFFYGVIFCLRRKFMGDCQNLSFGDGHTAEWIIQQWNKRAINKEN
jgi:hypothetical protein